MMNERYQEIIELKKQTDALLTQLSEGKYKDADILLNNYVHLQEAFAKFKPYMSDDDFIIWVIEKDKPILSEIFMTGRAIMCMHNFYMTMSTKNTK